jgi:moderate conductance mechanosensitive channel
MSALPATPDPPAEGLSLLGFSVSSSALAVLERAAEAAATILVAVVLLRLVPVLERFVIKRATRHGPVMGESAAELNQRVETLTRVTGSVARAIIWCSTVVLLLGTIGISVAPVIAGASIAGVAVGFGAQSIVKDFFSGFFILFENQFGVGDTVTVAGITGMVEQMTLRITVLRDAAGTAYFIPNSNIGNVANRTHGYVRVSLDVAFGALLAEEKARSALDGVVARIAADEGLKEAMLEAPGVEGPVDLAGGVETWRVAVKVEAGHAAAVKRAMIGALRAELQRAGLGYEAGVIVERAAGAGK